MLTVIDWVLNSHVVKGADESWLNTAGGWNMVTAQLEGCNLHWVPQGSGWEEEPGKAHEANVSQEKFPGWGPDLGCNCLGNTVSTSLRNCDSLSSGEDLITFNVAQEKSLGDTIQKVHESRLRPGHWSMNGKTDFVKGSSLLANNGADWSEQFVLALFSNALLELWRFEDLPL